MRIVSRKFHRDVPYDIAVLQVMSFDVQVFGKYAGKYTKYRLVATVNGIDHTLAETETEVEMDGIVDEILCANRMGCSDIEV